MSHQFRTLFFHTGKDFLWLRVVQALIRIHRAAVFAVFALPLSHAHQQCPTGATLSMTSLLSAARPGILARLTPPPGLAGLALRPSAHAPTCITTLTLHYHRPGGSALYCCRAACAQVRAAPTPKHTEDAETRQVLACPLQQLLPCPPVLLLQHGSASLPSRQRPTVSARMHT